MSQKLSIVQMKEQGIFKPGEFNGRHDRFKEDRFDLTWNPEARAISIRCRTTGALRIVDTSSCAFWDPKVEAKPEQKR